MGTCFTTIIYKGKTGELYLGWNDASQYGHHWLPKDDGPKEAIHLKGPTLDRFLKLKGVKK